MFWRVAGYTQPSPIEAILDKAEFALEELLDEDDLIQECKSLNGRLVAYLKERATVEKLIDYVVQPAKEGADPKAQFKYPYAACEVFCCEVDAVFTTLLEDEALMGRLFGLLGCAPPLDCVTAGYFARVVSCLLVRRSPDVLRYLEGHQGVLSQLVAHVDTTSVAEVLVRLVGADEQTSSYLSPASMAWMAATPVPDLLLDRLAPPPPPSAESAPAESSLTEGAPPAAAASAAVNGADTATGSTNDSTGSSARGSSPAAPAASGDAPASSGAPAGSGGQQSAAVAAALEGSGQAHATEGGAAEAGASNGQATVGAADAAAAAEPGPSGQAPAPTPQQSAAELAGPALARQKDGQKNAAEVLAAVARSQVSPLVGVLAQPAFLERLFARAFAPGQPTVPVQALDVCIALLEPRPPPHPNQQEQPGAGGPGEAELLAAELDAKLKAASVEGLAQYMGSLVALLAAPHGGAPPETPYGRLSPPLSLARLKAVELIAALLAVDHPAGEAAVLRSGALRKCMDLFEQFPFNNLLHHQVTAMLAAALDSGSHAVAGHLLDECGLLAWLANMPLDVLPPPNQGDPHADERPALRAGYLGHVTQLANKVGQVGASASGPLRAALETDADWAQYVIEVLTPKNEIENVMKWACGRPVATEIARVDSDDGEHLLNDPTEPLDELPLRTRRGTGGAGASGAAVGAASSPRDVGGGGAAAGGAGAGGMHRYGSGGFDDDDEEEHGQESAAEMVYFDHTASAFGNLRITSEPRPAAPRASGGGGSSSSSDDSDSEPDTPPSPARTGGAAHGGGAQALRSSLDDDVLVMTSDDDEVLDEDAVIVGAQGASPQRDGSGAAAPAFDAFAAHSASRSGIEAVGVTPLPTFNPFPTGSDSAGSPPSFDAFGVGSLGDPARADPGFAAFESSAFSSSAGTAASGGGFGEPGFGDSAFATTDWSDASFAPGAFNTPAKRSSDGGGAAAEGATGQDEWDAFQGAGGGSAGGGSGGSAAQAPGSAGVTAGRAAGAAGPAGSG